MSWTQVYITGLSRSTDPSDKEIETLLDARYNLTNDTAVMWAGPDTTLVKRDEMGCCRGFAFLTFYSKEGASIVIDRINNVTGTCSVYEEGMDNGDGEQRKKLPLQLRAEVSNPKGAAKERKQKGAQKKDDSDLRLRRQRKAPIRKHPVIVSSDGKRTNLGNKTR